MPSLILGETIESVLYRIVTELSSNAVKHASPSKIQLSLTHEDNSLILKHIDDGSGFDVQAALQNPQGMGLNNIQGRLHAIGGHLRIESSQGRSGTAITVTLPS